MPATRTPASPASTVPRGAIRNTSGAVTSGAGWKAAMPAPDTPPAESTSEVRFSSTLTTTGGKLAEVFGPWPALRLPLEDHMAMSPPSSVNSRLWFSRKSWSVKLNTDPPRRLSTPSKPSGMVVITAGRGACRAPPANSRAPS